MAIARLLGEDPRRTVAWLYRWETGNLGIRWTSADRRIFTIDRRLDPDVLARARSVGDLAIAAFLEALPVCDPQTS
ncbi:hypothetical protein A3731_20895 [Roseovarius sp. HI0049]|nr:hypothetical protein A3731_20895 [Roseovarius sp. HI0049]